VSAGVEVRVPDMGAFKDVVVIDVLVKPGDRVEVDGALLTLETEKATMDVPSTVAGVIERVRVARGGTVNAGDVIATVRAAEGAAVADAARPAPLPAEEATALAGDTMRIPVLPPSPPSPPSPAVARPAAAPARPGALPAIDEPGFSRAHASPSVRRFARELGVDLGRVKGTGLKERILEADVKAFVKEALSAGVAPEARGAAALPRVPVVDFAAFGPVEARPLSRVQRISGTRLHASWVNLPHVTQFDEADITLLEEARSKLKQKALQEGIKLTPLAFLVRACVRALQEFPSFNASLDPDGEQLIFKKYFHIGFAADTPQGLLVPVIRDADRKDVYEIGRALGELSEKARAGKLSASEMQGGSFTISSLGGIGGTAFTPIINAPEVAILGVARSSMKPVYRDGSFEPRLMLPLALSYDHRVIDGALGARFTSYLAATLADPRLLLEAVP
jgi:pyruvate dehydrogenase E2 component (dihydrolipoamide acetyltransferase)